MLTVCVVLARYRAELVTITTLLVDRIQFRHNFEQLSDLDDEVPAHTSGPTNSNSKGGSVYGAGLHSFGTGVQCGVASGVALTGRVADAADEAFEEGGGLGTTTREGIDADTHVTDDEIVSPESELQSFLRKVGRCLCMTCLCGATSPHARACDHSLASTQCGNCIAQLALCSADCRAALAGRLQDDLRTAASTLASSMTSPATQPSARLIAARDTGTLLHLCTAASSGFLGSVVADGDRHAIASIAAVTTLVTQIATFCAKQRLHSRGFVYVRMQVQALRSLAALMCCTGKRLAAAVSMADAATCGACHTEISTVMQVCRHPHATQTNQCHVLLTTIVNAMCRDLTQIAVDSLDSMIVPPPEEVASAVGSLLHRLCTWSSVLREPTIACPQFKSTALSVVAPHQSMAVHVQVSPRTWQPA